MTDDTTKTDPPEGTGGDNTGDKGTSQDDHEKAFWDRLGSTIEQRVDAVVEKRLKGLRPESGSTGNQRGKGRTTLPGILADLVFGPEKKD